MDKQQLKPCPFCGHDTPEFERLGTPRQSCIVVCGNCGCLHESSDEGEHNGASWNDRAPSPGVDAFQSSGDNAWKDLFWQVADILKCLPSTFVDANGHVLKAARRAMAAPSPAANAFEQERDRLRTEQAASVMPLIGPLLDAWDFAHNDVKASITADGIGRHLNAISLAMTTDREGVPHPPSRDCMCAACKPSFDNGANDPDRRLDITRGARDG